MKPDEIKELRAEKKLTQSALGKLCGVDKASISKWEKGKNNPSGAALKILEQLRDGDLIISELSNLEIKLLDQNVQVGNFRNREDYLTESLKYLLVHGEFLDILDASEDQPSQLVAEPSPEFNEAFKAAVAPDEDSNGTKET